MQAYYIHGDCIVFVAVLAAWKQLSMEVMVTSSLPYLHFFWLEAKDGAEVEYQLVKLIPYQVFYEMKKLQKEQNISTLFGRRDQHSLLRMLIQI